MAETQFGVETKYKSHGCISKIKCGRMENTAPAE